ncbi:hypothetical protein VE03_10698, partial [Pseudogymnoascus sp. 23342-1-I1]
MALFKGHQNRRRTDIKGNSGESDSEVEESRPKRIRRNTTPEVRSQKMEPVTLEA